MPVGIVFSSQAKNGVREASTALQTKGNRMSNLPNSVTIFLDEYEKLCRWHGLMVFSDGEQVGVGIIDSNLWNIRDGTENYFERGISKLENKT